ncbi:MULTISPECIES: ABC transporter ATP-binding protein [Shouchella]|uniref:ABC transporter ATP-binding protein n=1 Tax=Shouchella TaxID=2893057 RepID=UPI00270B39FB|nr:ABC transporter ATP-binding protein [Shouchella clausii]MDO7266968.1 ABC transporter ATP-binding protein [Shouchella clausii]MDO7286117.1 ABC transporter ATP-binding protein [Shouchella clausii]
MIKARNITKIYNANKQNELKVLKGINLDIRKGEFCTIIGKSGSGKTTMLKCLSGLENVTSGDIEVNNRDVCNLSKKEVNDFRRNDIAFVFQEYNLIDDLTLHENIYLEHPLNKEIESFIDEWDIRKAINLFPHQCSGGQQQKAAILRALVKESKILFCDEPTGALDGKSSREVLTVLQNLQQSHQTTIVLITHNEQITKISNRVITIHDGQKINDEVQTEVTLVESLEW